MNPQPTGPFRKSTYSGAQGNCVEIAPTTGGVLVRNSNRPDEAAIHYTKAELAAFLSGVKAGEFDDLA